MSRLALAALCGLLLGQTTPESDRLIQEGTAALRAGKLTSVTSFGTPT
jgi:hypothetical protein